MLGLNSPSMCFSNNSVFLFPLMRRPISSLHLYNWCVYEMWYIEQKLRPQVSKNRMLFQHYLLDLLPKQLIEILSFSYI